MTKSDVQELLVQLFLRLNGYFTTGLIVHSPTWGQQAQTEIDCLAIRNPYHDQPERCVEPSNFLGISSGMTDIILCEVKSEPEQVNFNTPLKENAESLKSVLRWAGVFPANEVSAVADKLRPLLNNDVSIEDMRNGVIIDNIRVRPLLCCPPQSEPQENRWCLTAHEIFEFANLCFNPVEARGSCSTRYNFQQWGYPFTAIVQYLKNQGIENKEDINNLYLHLGVA